MPNCFNMMKLKTFLKSITAICSRIILIVQMWSMHNLFTINPARFSLSFSLVGCVITPRTILFISLPAENKVIGLQFSQQDS